MLDEAMCKGTNSLLCFACLAPNYLVGFLRLKSEEHCTFASFTLLKMYMVGGGMEKLLEEGNKLITGNA